MGLGSRRPASTRIGAVRRPRLPRHEPSRKPRSPSSDARTSGSRRWSTGCCEKSACSSARCRGRRATPIDALLTWHRRQFRIVDTAGMRRPGRVARGGQVELVSVALRRQAIADADVVALLIDAKEGRDRPGRRHRRRGRPAGRGIVIVANKWDLVKSADSCVREDVRRGGCGDRLKFLDYAPILHISALTGERTPKVLETIDRVAAARRKRVPTPALNEFIETVTAANPPVSPGRRARPHPVRGADRRRAAVVRLLHQRRDDVSLLVRALPRQPAAREVRLRRHADPHQGPPPQEEGVGCAVQRPSVRVGCRRRCYTSHGSCPLAPLEFPNRALFKASEVCELIRVQPYVLRTWEAEFPELGIAKTAGAPRVYRRERRRAGGAHQASAPRRRPDACRRAPPARRRSGRRSWPPTRRASRN